MSRVLWVVENIDAEKRKANQLLYLSETDLMTGIRNRGSGERKIKEAIAEKQPGLFCLMDVDKFKTINDSFGHGIGDKVLIAIATSLKESFRESDVIMRLGGDEFAVFAKGITEKEIAQTLIERFFEKVESICIPEMGERKVTVSLGAILKNEEDRMDFEEMYRRADACTYESKKRSGNSCIFFS